VGLGLVEGNEGCQHAQESERGNLWNGLTVIYGRNGAEDSHISAIHTLDLVRKAASSGELNA
jgi:hypothetical protein